MFSIFKKGPKYSNNYADEKLSYRWKVEYRVNYDSQMVDYYTAEVKRLKEIYKLDKDIEPLLTRKNYIKLYIKDSKELEKILGGN